MRRDQTAPPLAELHYTGFYALSTLLHASQSWPLSRKQITPVLAIVNFFLAAATPSMYWVPLASPNPGTEQWTTRKTTRTEEDRSIDQGAVIFWLHCFARASGSKRVTANANDRNFIPGQCNPWSRFHAPDEARSSSLFEGIEFARFQVNIRPDNLSPLPYFANYRSFLLFVSLRFIASL